MIRLYKYNDRFSLRGLDFIEEGDIIEVKKGTFGKILNTKEYLVEIVIVIDIDNDSKQQITDHVLDGIITYKSIADIANELLKYIESEYLLKRKNTQLLNL